MAKQVLIFGAGASKHLGAPLMDDFIDAAHLLRETNPQVAPDAFDLVFEFLEKRLPMLYAKSKVDLRNIESVFSLLEMGRLLGRLPGTPSSEIERSLTAIRRVLVETLQWNCRFPVGSENELLPSDPYLAVASFTIF